MDHLFGGNLPAIIKLYVSVAKNYLSEEEIHRLERAVTGFFDYIE